MSVASRLKDLALSETGFVFDPYSGSTFTVNATGLAILQAIRDGLDRVATSARLRERFELRGEENVESDVADFVQMLGQNGLVPAEFTI
jgi:PqqD family protein of HPr-rel-A system